MGWQYKKKITISGSSGAGEGYQVLLKIGESSGAENYDFHLEGHSAKFPSDKGDGGDVRFVSADEETLLPFWVEKVEGTSPNRTAYVWVKIYDNLDNDVDIWIFYGNSEANNVSNGNNTFELFDDFDGDDIDTNKWTFICGNKGNGNYSVSNSILTWTDLPFGIKSSHSPLQSALLKAKYYQLNPTSAGSGLIWRNDTYGDKRLFQIWRDSGDWIWLYDTSQNKYDVANNFTSWGILEFIKDQNDNIKVYLNGEQQGGSYINTYALESVSLGNDGYSGSLNTSDFKFDWFFVRKYVEPEPSFYSAGTEEDAGNVGFEFTYLYVDKLTVSSGFTTLESAHTLVSSGFYMLMSSFLNSELSIETCQVRNKDKHSVTLVGRIVDSGGNSSVNVYFEYWRKDNPANIISTSVQTITDFTQPAYVFQDIDGLDEVTDYEYKAIIYVDENDKKEGGIVPFTTAGIRQVEIEQNIKFEENNSKIFLSDLYENINVAENSRLWDLLILKEYEKLGLLDGDLKFTFMFHYDEKLNLQDRYMNLFLSSYEEKAGFYVNRKYREPYPEKWIITPPANFNFSFEKDTDGDGIADGWKYENLVLSDCFIKNYYTKPTVQYIKFGENGKFYSECDLETKKIMLCLDLAVEGEVIFKVYDKNTGKIFYHKKYVDRDFETEIIKFNTDCPLVFEFSGSNSSLYLDNFVVLTDENLKKTLTGFSIFRYNIKGTNSDITFVRQYLKDEIMKKEFNLVWNWLPRNMFEIVKNMKGKQIYVRTPLNESFAFYVYGLENNMQNIKPNQEWEQKYQTALLVKEV